MRYRADVPQAFWISALTNHAAINTLMTDRKQNRQSIFILAERIAENYGLPTEAMGFLPVFNPADTSPWPELLGWLITFAKMIPEEEKQ